MFWFWWTCFEAHTGLHPAVCAVSTRRLLIHDKTSPGQWCLLRNATKIDFQYYWNLFIRFCLHRKTPYLDTHSFVFVVFIGRLSQQYSELTLPQWEVLTFLVMVRLWSQPLMTRPLKCGPSTGKSSSSLLTNTSTGSAVQSMRHNYTCKHGQ